MDLKTLIIGLGTIGAAIAVLTSQARAAEEVEGEIKIKDFGLEAG